MSAQDREEALERLAEDAARLLTRNPEAAADGFERAHELALALGDGSKAALLSVLVARSWSVRGSTAQAIRFSRRAVREAPRLCSPYYTLGHFYEKAAGRASGRGYSRRAIVLFMSAHNAFAAAAEATDGELDQDDMKRLAEACERKARQLLDSGAPR
jgi:hypothetical protein